MSQHRRDVRPRYGRIAVLATSTTVTVVAGLAGIGVLAPSTVQADQARPTSYSSAAPRTSLPTSGSSSPSSDLSSDLPTDVSTDVSTGASQDVVRSGVASQTQLPAASGTGRRIVFSERLQRVWLVGADGAAERTYPVSGSLTDNLQPGTYAVTGRERHAIGIDDSGTMQYFVVFTAGPTGAAIGFHSIPVKDGVPLQTKAQLGTPQSHGCIRQATPDAVALWDFAPVGTKVVVV